MKQKNPCIFRPWERKGENKVCFFCEDNFYVPRALLKKGGGKYCSRKCYYGSKKNGELKNCLVCKKEFYTTPCFKKKGWGKYCSKRCRLPMTNATREKIAEGHRGEKSYLWRGGRKEVNEMRIDNYKWRILRKKIYERDGWKCQKCNKHCSRGSIACHHIIPWRATYDDNPENLITLCNSCHIIEDYKYRTNEERTAVFTVVSDDYYYPIGTPKFINSFLYFHPDKNIDLFVFRQDIINTTFLKHGLNFYNSRPTFAKILVRMGYKLIVGIDADTVILSRLDGVLAEDYEIGCPINYNDYENRTVENVTEKEFVQAGLVASRNPKFWDIWERENKNAMKYTCKENDILSLIWKNDPEIQKMKKKVFDQDENYYGCKSLGRENEFYMQDGQVMCRKEKVICYHHAKGTDFPKLQYERMGFAWDVINYMNKVSNSGTSFKIKGI